MAAKNSDDTKTTSIFVYLIIGFVVVSVVGSVVSAKLKKDGSKD